MKEKKDLFGLLQEGVTLANFKKAAGKSGQWDRRDEEGYTYLHWAIIKNNKAVALYLIDRGCKLNVKNHAGITPLEYAIQFGEQEIAERLIAKKAKWFNREGYGPLHAAAVSGSRKMLTGVLRWFPDLNAPDEGGYTPLHWACQEGRLETVKVLVGRGALVNVLDRNGITPLRAALGEGHAAVFQFLVTHGALVGDFDRNTLLHQAVVWGRAEMADVLLDSDTDIDASDRWGNTPLHYAHMYKRQAMENLLLEKGANTTIRNRFGILPLEADLNEFDKLTDDE